jgi:hypothetical protein
MNLKPGEVYICTEPCCKAEIVVRRGANPECPGKYTVRCCCGKEMTREDQLVFATPKRAAKQA